MLLVLLESLVVVKRHIQSLELMTKECRCCVKLTDVNHFWNSTRVKHVDTQLMGMEHLDSDMNSEMTVNEVQFHDCVEVVK